jgi:cytochrome P450
MDDGRAFDPFDDHQSVPWEYFSEVRRSCPVMELPTAMLFLSRYEDVHDILRDGGERVRHFSHEGGMRAPGVVVPDEEQLINELDGARHTRRRKLLMSALHPRLIAAAEPYIRDQAAQLLQPLLDSGGGDLVAAWTQPLPGMVFAHVLGLPEDDYPRFKAWSDEVLAGTYPRLNRTERGEGLHGAHPELSGYIDALADNRRHHPRDDLITRMVNAEQDGERLSQTEVRVLVMHLLIAGHETTTNLLGNLLHHLLTSPAHIDALRADPALIPVAVEESLRRDPPVLIQPLSCVAAAVHSGTAIAAGSRVVLSIAAANRDPGAYDDPDEFRLDRTDPAAHNAFGGGPHFCPGAPLARLEARVALEVFFDRVQEATLDAEQEEQKVPVFWANGPEHLRVRLTPRALASIPHVRA